jgi:hypothetical protein
MPHSTMKSLIRHLLTPHLAQRIRELGKWFRAIFRHLLTRREISLEGKAGELLSDDRLRALA